MNYENPENKSGVAYFEAGRAQGRTEMLEAIRWLAKEARPNDVTAIVGVGRPYEDLFDAPADLIVSSVKEYREAHDFRIGDVVKAKSGRRFVITAISPAFDEFPPCVSGINFSGHLEHESTADVTRTGEYAEQVAELLRIFRRDEDE